MYSVQEAARSADSWSIIIGVRGGCSGGRPPPPSLKNFRANSVFKASASCSKILNNQKYIFSTVNSRHPLFFRARASCKTPECKKHIQYSEKFQSSSVFQAELKFFRASASCSKLPNVKRILNKANTFRATVFQRKRLLLKNPEWQKIFQYSENFQGKLCFQGKRKLLKILNTKSTFNIVKNFRATVFSGQAQVAQKSW